MPHVFRVVVHVDLPVLELALEVLVSVLILDRFRSRSGCICVDEPQDGLVGFSCAPFWERLAIDVRRSARFTVDVGVDQLVHGDWNAHVDAMLEAPDHCLFRCMPEPGVQ